VRASRTLVPPLADEFAVRNDESPDRRIGCRATTSALCKAEGTAHENDVDVSHVATIPAGNSPIFQGFSGGSPPPRRSIAYTLPGRFFEKLFISVATSTSSR